ncbi:MAG: DUF2500 family protein [Clostridia bacterium]|nr:DUF2500 family protein [Clostridia bacterium]
MNNIINLFFIFIFLLCWLFILRKMILNKFAPVKTVKAEVVDKYKSDVVTKYHGTFKTERYVVIFKTKNEKLILNVSQFTYDNYKINDKGTLKYKGTKIISFKQ